MIRTAKKTGDYAVLSHADLCVLALTLALHTKEEATSQTSAAVESGTDAEERNESSVTGEQHPETGVETGEINAAHTPASSEAENLGSTTVERAGAEPSEPLAKLSLVDNEADGVREPLDVALEPLQNSNPPPLSNTTAPRSSHDTPIFDDPSDEDDGEGEWITPDNVNVHKSCALDLFPSSDSRDAFTAVSGKKNRRKGSKQNGEKNGVEGPREQIKVGCMTADFAMQNVLLQMDLNLVGLEGKRIDKVKTWVLRCHACFK